MALRFPARTKGTTAQTGSLSTFTVAEPVAAGWRTFTKATSDLDLANGDTVGLIIVDTTVTTGVNLLQVVTASWNNTTKQFTITQNHQPAVPPSWGAGVRDVVVIDNPALFLLLAGGTMTGVLNILISGALISPAAETGLVVQRSGGTSNCAASVISSQTGIARLNFGHDFDEDVGGLHYNHATHELVTRTNGVNRVKIDSAGVLRNAAGDAYLTSVAASFPSGTVMLFYQAAAPEGWTKLTTQNDKALRVVSGVGGGSGGTNGLSALISDGTSLSIAQMPTHSHEVHYVVGSTSVGSSKDFVDNYDGGGGNVLTSEKGSGAPHSHSISLAYIDVIICSKN